jgi:hypothetical protein
MLVLDLLIGVAVKLGVVPSTGWAIVNVAERREALQSDLERAGS